MKEKIVALIIEAITELNEELEAENLNEPNMKTKLYGANGNLDSLALVSFISDVEFKISDELDIDITLADERAMSQKTSPFRNVETLVKYTLDLVEKEMA